MYKVHTFFLSFAGHFTQIVWKGSTELGIGKAQTRDGKWLVVANYHPAGNFIGRNGENVLPPVSGKVEVPSTGANKSSSKHKIRNKRVSPHKSGEMRQKRGAQSQLSPENNSSVNVHGRKDKTVGSCDCDYKAGRFEEKLPKNRKDRRWVSYHLEDCTDCDFNPHEQATQGDQTDENEVFEYSYRQHREHRPRRKGKKCRKNSYFLDRSYCQCRNCDQTVESSGSKFSSRSNDALTNVHETHTKKDTSHKGKCTIL